MYFAIGVAGISIGIWVFALVMPLVTSWSKCLGVLLSRRLRLAGSLMVFKPTYKQIGVVAADCIECFILKTSSTFITISTMDTQPDKQYVLTDIMRKRKKDRTAVQNKINSKLALKSQRKKSSTALKAPDTFIKRYRHQQKSYAHYQQKNRQNKALNPKQEPGAHKLLLVVRVRGTTDISKPQSILLSKLNLRKVNTAIFVVGTPAILRQLRRVENYITWGEPNKKIISQLIYKKLHGKVGEERVHIKSNAQVEQHLGGDIICLEDIINQIAGVGPNFQQIMEFIFPFKLTTPPGTLASRLRKPVGSNGHWGYRADDINNYVELMI